MAFAALEYIPLTGFEHRQLFQFLDTLRPPSQKFLRHRYMTVVRERAGGNTKQGDKYVH